MKEKIFLSYSSANKDLVEQICSKFESAGLQCWMAPRDISPGADWAEAIIDAIDEAKTMVVVFTREANESVQVKREIERAVSKNRPVLPLKKGDFIPSKSMEYFLSSHHWHILDEKNIEKSIEEVIKKLGGQAKTQPTEPKTHSEPDRKPASRPSVETKKEPLKKTGKGVNPLVWAGLSVVVILAVVFFIFKPFGSDSNDSASDAGEDIAIKSPADLMGENEDAGENTARKLNKNNVNKVYGEDTGGEMDLPEDIGENLSWLSRTDIEFDKKKEISELTLEKFVDREVPVNLMIGDIVDEQIGVYDYMVRLSTMTDVSLKTIKVEKDANGKIKELFLESDQ